MTNTTIKSNYRKKYPTRLPKEDYQLYKQWQDTCRTKRQYFNRRQLEKKLRHRGYGYLVGDLPKKGDVSYQEYQMIIRYRQLRVRKDFDGAKLIRKHLREVGLGVFAGDLATQEKPPLKDRIFTVDNILVFSDAINAPVLGFMDTEFTTRRHEILSIGCVVYHTASQHTETFYRTVKPYYEKKLSSRCMELTHLTQKEIDASPVFGEVIEQFSLFLKQNQVEHLMTWGNSDYGSLKTSFSYAKHSLKSRDYILNMIVDVQPIISLLRDENRSQFSLHDMKDYYQLPGTVLHHALQDAVDLKNVILAFKEQHNQEKKE